MLKRITAIITAAVMLISVMSIVEVGNGTANAYAESVEDEQQYEYIMTVDPIPDQLWQGKDVCPVPKVYVNGVRLKKSQFTCNYVNNGKVGYGYIDIEIDPVSVMGGSCLQEDLKKFNKVQEQVTFKILDPMYKTTEGPIGDISKVKNYYYTGKPIIPEYKVWGANVYLNKWVLIKEGEDYTAKISNNVKPGRAEIAVTGITYSGTHYRNFKILKAPIKMTTVSGITDRYYSGKAQVQNKIKITYNGMTLKKGRDYTVAYKNNKKAGKASVIITGKGQFYTGTVTKTFNIVKGKIGKVTLTNVASVDHNAVKLTWKKAANARKYQVWKSTSKNGKYTLIKTTTATEFTNQKLTTGKTYYYKVRAINGTLKGAFSAVRSAIPVL